MSIERKKSRRQPKRDPRQNAQQKQESELSAWVPRTRIGIKVKSGEISSMDMILDKGMKILEPEIAETLLPGLETELLLIGQSKGKFGGGQRRVFKQTQKKTREGNKPKFATMAIVGNKNGYIGLGYGKSKETVPAREKALKRAKTNMFKIRRECADWQCNCPDAHTVPFKVEGKCGSVKLILMPAPKGKGLCVESECQKILRLAGIKDVWSKTHGQTKTKINLVLACMDALRKLMTTKISADMIKDMKIIEGSIAKMDEVTEVVESEEKIEKPKTKEDSPSVEA